MDRLQPLAQSAEKPGDISFTFSGAAMIIYGRTRSGLGRTNTPELAVLAPINHIFTQLLRGDKRLK